MAKNSTLTAQEQSMLKKMFIYCHFVFVNFNMTKMEANCFTMAMAPAIEAIYGDDKEAKSAAYVRHNAFFNTHAVPLAFIVGLAAGMEKDVATGKIPGQTVDAIKASLMGPTAGMFDSIFFNCLRIIAAGIGIGLCSQGNILGTILFMIIYGGSQEVVRWIFVHTGYTLGLSFIDSIYSSGLIAHATRSAGILGLMMVGTMTATTVKVPLNWTITVGEAAVEVLPLVDAIYPGLLSVIVVLLCMFAGKKGFRPTLQIVTMLVVSMLFALLGIF